MESFTIALIQQDSPVGKKDSNIEQTIIWSEKAKAVGASIACFPELNITGHAGHPLMVGEAEDVPDGPSCTKLVELSGELDMYICAGLAECDKGIHYNTYFIAGPEGYIGKQRKVHLSRDEYFYFRAGTKLPVFDLSFVRTGIAICYDNEVPEISRCFAVNGAELLLCPHAARFGSWPNGVYGREKAVREQKDHWRLVHSCRSYDNGVYVALCNTAGNSSELIEDVEANHAGCCMVFDPYGKLIAESKSSDIAEEMVVASLDPKPLHDRRTEPCFNLQTRKPEVFGVLSEQTD